LNVDSNEAEDSEVINKWEEQVRKEQADRDRGGHQGRPEKASGSSEGRREGVESDLEGEEVVQAEAQDMGDVRHMKKLIDPKLPSKEEVNAHEMTHLPFRNWCRHCVKGRGVETPHRKSERDERGIPEVHVDYAFPTSTVGTEGLIVLVARRKNVTAEWFFRK